VNKLNRPGAEGSKWGKAGRGWGQEVELGQEVEFGKGSAELVREWKERR
jgi:hypothetical protein